MQIIFLGGWNALLFTQHYRKIVFLLQTFSMYRLCSSYLDFLIVYSELNIVLKSETETLFVPNVMSMFPNRRALTEVMLVQYVIFFANFTKKTKVSDSIVTLSQSTIEEIHQSKCNNQLIFTILP